MKEIKNCLSCNKPFLSKKNYVKNRKNQWTIFCSISCGKKGKYNPMFKKPSFNRGKRLPYATGEKNVKWKENPGYRALHTYVRYWSFEPKECVYCGARDTRIEWANIYHETTRNLDDYIPLCVSCHRRYDHPKNRKIRRIIFT